ncbi:MAG: SufD family Fe-S cluster assembly protein, partial [Nanoarchaeota archaeon]
GGQYDCLTEDTLIPTNPEGMVKIKDIKENDKIFAWDEKTNRIVKSKVKGVLDKGTLPVFEIKIRGKTIKATYNHPFLALIDRRKLGRQRSRYSKEWRYLNELKKGDIIAIATNLPDFGKSFKFSEITYKKNVVGRNQFGAIYNLNIENNYAKVKFPRESNTDIMWLFGFYLGDGYITGTKGKDKMKLNFAVPENQIELKNKIKEIIKKYFDYNIKTEDKFRICINSTKICLFFKENGFMGGAKSKQIPKWVSAIPKEQKLALIAGYIDSDGTVRKKEKDIIITSINYGLLKQTKELCAYCGLNTSKITTFKSKDVTNKEIMRVGHRLQITGRTKYIPCTHPVKKLRLESRKTGFGKYNSLRGTTIRKYCSEDVGFSRIEDIKYIGKEKTYDIEVNNYHNFVANNIIAHNSTVIYHRLKEELAKQGVIFEDMDVALQKYPELIKEYFMTKCIPITLHKYIALHGACWSGGTFIYIPEGVKLDQPLQAYFRMNTESFGQFEHTLIILDKNSEASYIEGCFTKGTLIQTNPDIKPIEEIKSGDKVLTHKGDYKKVYFTQARPYTGKLYKIKVYGDSSLELETTEEHPFLSVKRKYKNDRNKIFDTNWVKAKELNKHDYLTIPINKVKKSLSYRKFKIEKNKKKINLNVKTNKGFFKLAGYYLAEGSTSANNSYLNFSFNEKEKEYIKEVESLIKKLFNVKTIRTYHKKNHGLNVVVCSVVLGRLFAQEFGKGNSNKKIPQWMMIENLEKQKELIKSWFYGDGNYYNKKHKSGLKEVFRINTTSEKLARQGKEILLRLNIFAFLNQRFRKKENRKTMWTLGISGESMLKFGKIVNIKIKSELYNKKRATRFYIDKDYAYVPIKDIKVRNVIAEPVYNFGVDENESYTANSVIVHNCSSPKYNNSSLHAGCVELFVKEGARLRYSSAENWSNNTYNLNTKRAIVEKNGTIEWITANLGSKVSMVYPCSMLIGENARADHLSIGYAGKNQVQDIGAKIFHLAPDTTSIVKSKSISKDGGIARYRGILYVAKNAVNSKSKVQCDALMMDDISTSDTIPSIEVKQDKSSIAHEATVGKISREQIFYLMSRGVTEEQATQMIVNGFIEPIVKELPIEYAVELNRLIELEMEGSLG